MSSIQQPGGPPRVVTTPWGQSCGQQWTHRVMGHLGRHFCDGYGGLVYFVLKDVGSPVTNIVLMYGSAGSPRSTTHVLAVSATAGGVPVVDSGPSPLLATNAPGTAATFTVHVSVKAPVTPLAVSPEPVTKKSPLGFTATLQIPEFFWPSRVVRSSAQLGHIGARVRIRLKNKRVFIIMRVAQTRWHF